jgi:hypothetical protein
MKQYIDQCSYQQTFNFYIAEDQSLPMEIVGVSIKKDAGRVLECRLKAQIDWPQYQQIASRNLFNLKAELRTDSGIDHFDQSLPLKISLMLSSEHLSRVTQSSSTAAAIADFLYTSNQDPVNQDLFDVNHWFLLSTNQDSPDEKIGYRTLWSYLNFDAIAQGRDIYSVVFAGIAEFSKHLDQSGGMFDDASVLAALSRFSQMDWDNFQNDKQAQRSILESLSTLFQSLVEQNLSLFLDDSGDEISSDLGKDFKQTVSENLGQLIQSTQLYQSLETCLLDFFAQEQWNYEQLEQRDPKVFQFPFKGQSGEWQCQAWLRESNYQILLYSYLPVRIADARRAEVSEFITRANYGLVIGNFELDLSDGELRFKTSLDVEGSSIDTALIKQLCYANVLTMDKYLPGLIAVLDNGVPPESAIQQVEA